MKHASDPLPALRDGRSDVPKGLERVIEKLMAKTAKRRFQRWADIIDALEAARPRDTIPGGLIPRSLAFSIDSLPFLLLSAIPVPDPGTRNQKQVLPGDVPSPIDPPPGSAFGHRISHPLYESTIGMDLGLREIAPRHHVAADPCCLTEKDWKILKDKETVTAQP